MAPLFSSKNRVFRPNAKHAWPRTPGFPAISHTLLHFSNTSKNTIEFFQSFGKNTPSNITIINNEVHYNSSRLNKANPPRHSWRDTFTSIFRIPLISQTEYIQIFKMNKGNNSHNFLQLYNSTKLGNKFLLLFLLYAHHSSTSFLTNYTPDHSLS